LARPRPALSKPLGDGAAAALGLPSSSARRRRTSRAVPAPARAGRSLHLREFSPCLSGRSCRPPLPQRPERARGKGDQPAVGGRPPALFQPAAREPVLARSEDARLPAPRARTAAAP